MDSDRKSGVSSYYGRKSSDALNADFPSPTAPHFPGRAESSTSFYDPRRSSHGSMDLLNNNGRQSTAGYNQHSFLATGRQEPLKGGRDEHADEEMGLRGPDEEHDGGWDVYADFNNTGPRYSTAFVQPQAEYQAITPEPKAGEHDDEDTASARGNYETVTVPALGAEWKASELRDMTKAGKREKKTESRRQKFKEWNRNERGLCCSCFTRRVFVFFMFGLIAAVAITLAFTIPRVPGFSFNTGQPLQAASPPFNDSIPVQFSGVPANFSFPAVVDIQLDTGSNYLPLVINHMDAQVFDLDTNMQVATGTLGKTTLPAKSFPHVRLPLNFTYTATNTSDQTWTNWHKACQNKAVAQGGSRPGVNFRLVVDSMIAGLVGKRTTSTSISDASCPIELPSTSI